MDPDNVVAAAKRLIGKTPSTTELTEYRRRHPGKVEIDREKGFAFRTRVGAVTPVEIATHILQAAVRNVGYQAENVQAVITVPAAFSKLQREATALAGKNAGFARVEITEEPVATAIGHGAKKDQGIPAVYDIGGGTFDFSVMDCKLWPIGILDNGGDLQLGGDDFDEAIAAHCAATLLMQHRWDLRADPGAFFRLVAEAERAKIRYSHDGEAVIALDKVAPGNPAGVSVLRLDRSDFARCCYNLVRRTFQTCDDVLERVEMTPLQIDTVFLAGGATQLPILREWVVTYFGVEPASEVSPFEAVARGASLIAKEAFA
jgi:molecular chaperone DnaK (HSP70)